MYARIVCTFTILLLCFVSSSFCDGSPEEVKKLIAYFCDKDADWKTRVNALKCMEKIEAEGPLSVWTDCRDAHLPGKPNETERNLGDYCCNVQSHRYSDFSKCYFSRAEKMTKEEIRQMLQAFTTCTSNS